MQTGSLTVSLEPTKQTCFLPFLIIMVALEAPVIEQDPITTAAVQTRNKEGSCPKRQDKRQPLDTARSTRQQWVRLHLTWEV